jgi:hypothetical protein
LSCAPVLLGHTAVVARAWYIAISSAMNWSVPTGRELCPRWRLQGPACNQWRRSNTCCDRGANRLGLSTWRSVRACIVATWCGKRSVVASHKTTPSSANADARAESEPEWRLMMTSSISSIAVCMATAKNSAIVLRTSMPWPALSPNVAAVDTGVIASNLSHRQPLPVPPPPSWPPGEPVAAVTISTECLSLPICMPSASSSLLLRLVQLLQDEADGCVVSRESLCKRPETRGRQE